MNNKVVNSNNIIDIDNCSICLELLDTTHINYTQLKLCKHSFHTQCIVTWLSMGHKICPLCKQLIDKSEELDPLPPPMIELNTVDTNQNENDKYSALEHIMLCILSLVIIFYLANLQRLQHTDDIEIQIKQYIQINFLL